MLLADRLLGTVAPLLGRLPWKVVYLGGSTTHLHLTDSGAPTPELTDDVDVVVEVTSPVEFQVHLRQKLRELGAKEDTSEDAPLCRWILAGLKVDVMSPNEAVLGFANRWYGLALSTARSYELPGGSVIELIFAPVFLASKLEAYGDRGRGCLSSKDVDDIIALLDGRSELAEEFGSLPADLCGFVAQALQNLLLEADFDYAVEGYLRDRHDRAEAVHRRARHIVTVCQNRAASEHSE